MVNHFLLTLRYEVKEATKGKTVRQRLGRLSDELSALKANATDNALIPPDAKVLSESSDVKKGKRKPQSTGEGRRTLFWGIMMYGCVICY